MMFMMASTGILLAGQTKVKPSGQEHLKAVSTTQKSSSCSTIQNPCCSPDGKCGKEFMPWCAKEVPDCPRDHKPTKGVCRPPLQNPCPVSQDIVAD